MSFGTLPTSKEATFSTSIAPASFCRLSVLVSGAILPTPTGEG